MVTILENEIKSQLYKFFYVLLHTTDSNKESHLFPVRHCQIFQKVRRKDRWGWFQRSSHRRELPGPGTGTLYFCGLGPRLTCLRWSLRALWTWINEQSPKGLYWLEVASSRGTVSEAELPDLAENHLGSALSLDPSQVLVLWCFLWNKTTV